MLFTAPADVLSYTFKDAELGRTHFFLVKAVNQFWESKATDVVRVDLPPSPPLNLTVSTGYGYANLSWEQPTQRSDWEIYQYIVLRKGGNEADWMIIEQIYDRSAYFMDDSS